MRYNKSQLVRKVDHYDLTTRDIVETAKFYRKLGFRYNNDKNYLYDGNFLIKLHKVHSRKKLLPKNVSVGSIDICFKSNLNCNQILAYLNSKNIPVAFGPVQSVGFDGKMTSIYVYDPSGNLLEFAYYRKPIPVPYPIPFPFPIRKKATENFKNLKLKISGIFKTKDK